MNNFVFYNPVKIIFGKEQISQLTNEIPKDKRVLLVYGGGSIKKNNVYDQVINALRGFTVFEFGGIEPNPQYKTLMNAVQIIKEQKIDFVLAVGGGSVIDGTKFIVAAAYYDGDPWDIMFDWSLIKRALPFGTVLTLPATASEMNCGAVISRGEDKLHFISPLVFPKFSILDPEVTYTLPPKQTANGIVDAFVHVMEQYLTYPVNSPVQDRLSEGLLLTLIEEAPKVFRNAADYAARANIMWCAALGLNGWAATGVLQDWSTHMIGHEITALYGLDHGQTLAIILPNVMEVKREQKHVKLLQYAERVWNVVGGNEEQKINQAIAKTREFFNSIGVKTRLRDYGIGEDCIPKLLTKLDQHGMTALGEHQDITLEQSAEILRRSL